MKAVIYARYSSHAQREESIEGQLRVCYEYAKQNKADFIFFLMSAGFWSLKNQIKFVPKIRYQDVPFTHECYLKADKCLRVSRYMNIYRKGHPSATYSFNLNKAKDLCIAIANTWKLKRIENLSPAVKYKLDNDIFVSFSLLIYFMLYGIKSPKEREEIFAFLRNEVPDLSFSNGLKQKVTSFIYNKWPNMYFLIRKAFIGLTPKPNSHLNN